MTDNNTKTIRLVADVVAPAAIVLVTIALFFLFKPEEPGTLFWTNMVYTAFLEIILFAYIVWLPVHGTSLALKWMCGIYSVVYIAIALLWMLLYGCLLFHWVPLKVYFAFIAVLTVLWIFVGALSLKVDHGHDTSTAILSENRQRANEVNNSGEMYLQQFNLLLKLHPELNGASAAVTSLCRSLASLSPLVLSSPRAARQIQDIDRELEELLTEPVSEEQAMRLKEFSDKSLITLNFLKKSVRK